MKCLFKFAIVLLPLVLGRFAFGAETSDDIANLESIRLLLGKAETILNQFETYPLRDSAHAGELSKEFMDHILKSEINLARLSDLDMKEELQYEINKLLFRATGARQSSQQLVSITNSMVITKSNARGVVFNTSSGRSTQITAQTVSGYQGEVSLITPDVLLKHVVLSRNQKMSEDQFRLIESLKVRIDEMLKFPRKIRGSDPVFSTLSSIYEDKKFDPTLKSPTFSAFKIFRDVPRSDLQGRLLERLGLKDSASRSLRNRRDSRRDSNPLSGKTSVNGLQYDDLVEIQLLFAKIEQLKKVADIDDFEAAVERGFSGDRALTADFLDENRFREIRAELIKDLNGDPSKFVKQNIEMMQKKFDQLWNKAATALKQALPKSDEEKHFLKLIFGQNANRHQMEQCYNYLGAWITSLSPDHIEGVAPGGHLYASASLFSNQTALDRWDPWGMFRDRYVPVTWKSLEWQVYGSDNKIFASGAAYPDGKSYEKVGFEVNLPKDLPEGNYFLRVIGKDSEGKMHIGNTCSESYNRKYKVSPWYLGGSGWVEYSSHNKMCRDCNDGKAEATDYWSASGHHAVSGDRLIRVTHHPTRLREPKHTGTAIVNLVYEDGATSSGVGPDAPTHNLEP